MASLELEARLDNLLYTAREETADYNLFAPIPLREECPICMLPLPIVNNETIFMKCCGKSICMGCICRNLITEETKVEDYKCALCCQPNPKTIKALKKLMKRNNHEAFIQMANHYEEGDGVIQSNTKSLEMIFRAAELGHSAAFGMIGSYYQDGMAVKQDLSKALEFYEVAAKKGSIEGHKALTQSHENNGNINEAIEHLKVVASVGDQGAMDKLMKHYKDKLVSKEDLTQTLRACQTSSSEMKSRDRDTARLLEESRKKGEVPRLLRSDYGL